MRNIIVICGPTAVGKTEYAIKTANSLNGEIVNADSMQIYKFMDIGSAKPTPEETAACRHHLVDCVDPREPFSVSEYRKAAKKAIEEIFERGMRPVVSGGTGLYVHSLIYDMDFSAPPPVVGADNPLRSRLYELAESDGREAVHAMLRKLDPDAAARIHPNNLKKTVRAIEVAKLTGKKNRTFDESFVPAREYDCTLIGLERDRAELYERINKRVDILVEKGLIEEVEGLLKMGLSENDISMKGIGYKEIIDYLHGFCTRDTAIELIKRNTRHLAKRQMTWFRRYDDMKWFNISRYNSDADCQEEIIRWLSSK